MVERIIQPKAINSFIEPQVYSENESYKLSVFVCIERIGDKVLLYNTLTGAMLCIPNEESVNLNIFSSKHHLPTESIKELVSLHFLVSSSIDETKRYQELHDLVLAFDSSTGIRRYNILTTTACNLKCYYCFENGVKASRMNTETAESLVDYIVRSYDKTKPIQLRWFGGEPLVNTEVISIICKGLTEKGIDFYSTMSSNGVLFTPDLISKLPEWKLKKVRFSLDGYGKEHDVRKGFNTNGTIFEKVIQNITALLEHGVNVTIRLTIDSKSIDKMEELALWLVDKYRQYDNVSIYNRLVFQEVNSDAYEKRPSDVKELVKKVEALDQLLFKNGMYDKTRIAPVGFNAYYCAAADPHAVVVCPDGSLCSCETVTNDTKFWGDIWNGETDRELHKQWLNSNVRSKCKQCCFLPVCTPFDLCCIDYFDCQYKMHYTHTWYMKIIYEEYLNKR